MKLNKLIAAASAVTMIGSMVVVPAMATDGEPDIYTRSASITANVSAQLRALDGGWTAGMNNASKIVTGTDNIEIRGGKDSSKSYYIGAFFLFDTSSIQLPSDASIQSVTLTMEKGNTKTGTGSLTVLETGIPNVENQGKTSALFTLVQSAIANTSSNRTTFNYAETTSVNVQSMYTSTDQSVAFFVYNPSETDGNRYDVKASPTLTINYTTQQQPVYNTALQQGYDTLNDAIAAVRDGDTIELRDNITLTTRIVQNDNDNDYTINGNGYKITNPGAMVFEFKAGSDLTVSNLTVDQLDFKGSSTIDADNLTIGKLALAGNNTGSKGTVKNSTITTLSTYGCITLANTDVSSVEVRGINSSTNRPVITADDTSLIGTVVINSIDQNAVMPYKLFDSTLPAGEVTVPEGYTYSNGVISLASTEPDKYDTGYFEFREPLKIDSQS